MLVKSCKSGSVQSKSSFENLAIRITTPKVATDSGASVVAIVGFTVVADVEMEVLCEAAEVELRVVFDTAVKELKAIVTFTAMIVYGYSLDFLVLNWLVCVGLAIAI